MPTPRPAASAAEVAASIRAIRDYHAIGCQSLKDLPGRGGYDDGTIAAQAKEHGFSDTMIRKARQFADPVSGYGTDELKNLFALIREYRPIFGPTHIGLLVTVPRDDREDLQRRCIEGNWSKSELKAAIKLRFGPRRFGGRRRRVASDPAQALVQLDEMASTWRRWVVVASDGPDGETVMDNLGDEVKKQVRKIDKLMAALSDHIKDKQDRGEPVNE